MKVILELYYRNHLVATKVLTIPKNDRPPSPLNIHIDPAVNDKIIPKLVNLAEKNSPAFASLTPRRGTIERRQPPKKGPAKS